MAQKIFKTIDEQIAILRDKGLVINDVELAKEKLFRENYFFICGYRHLFMENSKIGFFNKGTTFEELYAMFVFDRRLRNIIFKNILIVENNIKSIISYQLSKKYGYKEKDYLNPKNFTTDTLKSRQVHDILNKMKRQIRVNGKQHAATQHYLSNYGYIPMWILVKVLSFGIVSELYSILKEEDRTSISNVYNIDTESLGIYLSILSNFRNLCAHEDILYDHKTQRQIPDCKYHYKLDITMVNDDYIYGKNDLFALVIIMKTMLSKKEFRDFMNEICYEVDYMEAKIKSIPFMNILNKIGFPCNFRDLLDID